MEIRVIPKHTYHKANSIYIIQKSVCDKLLKLLTLKNVLINFELDMTLYM